MTPAGRGGVPFALHVLDDIQRSAYERWVRGAIAVALVGYAVVTIFDVAILGFSPYTLAVQGATIAACGVALALAYHGRLDHATALAVAAVWVELHSALLVDGMAAASLLVFPVLVVVTGLLHGGGAGYAVAALTSLTAPAVALFGHRVLGTPIRDASYEIYLGVQNTAVLFIAASVVEMAMRQLGAVVSTALAARRRVEKLIEHAPDGIVAVDGQGFVVAVNPAAERILRKSRSDLIERPLVAALGGRIDFGHGPDDLAMLLADPDSAPSTPVEVTAGDRTLYVEVAATRFEESGGSEIVQLTLHDVTARIQAERHDRVLQARLEESNRLDAVGRLAGGIAHDFNNHLTVIGGTAELLLAKQDQDIRDMAREILEARLRAAALTRQLLAFARRDVVSPRVLSLAAVVTDVRPLLKSLLGDAIELHMQTDAEVPPIFADRSQVEHVLVNLVSNARDVLPEGGKVTIKVTAPGAVSGVRVAGGERVPRGFVELVVSDDGPGMDEPTARRAFEPFFTTSEFGQRSGLGLSTVHGVVTQNGGAVTLETALGAGTSARVLWPVALRR